MEQDELLRTVVGSLERLEIPYLITGSIATIFYGEPRFTNDIDVVVLLTEAKLALLVDEFPAPEYYLDKDAARDAVRRRRQFNLIQPRSGLKVDFIAVENSPFNQNRFSRAVRVHPAADFEASFASAEDIILMKLKYYRMSESERHLRDIAGVVKIQGEALDKTYITEWATKLGLEALWRDFTDKT